MYQNYPEILHHSTREIEYLSYPLIFWPKKIRYLLSLERNIDDRGTYIITDNSKWDEYMKLISKAKKLIEKVRRIL